MRRLGFSLALTLTLGGCVVGAPPGWSGGDSPSNGNESWTIPLVDPLADGRLLVPVLLHGHGPFLFAIDPDAPVSVIDDEAVAAAGVPVMDAVRIDGWSDVTRPVFTADIPDVRLGDLTISVLHVLGSRNAIFDGDGHRIYGILGRDLIKDSVVFGFDRERGVAWLATNKAFVPPAGATILPYFKGSPRVTPKRVVHKLVHARVNGAAYDMHLDLAQVQSQLRSEDWTTARLAVLAIPSRLVDETGMPHTSSEIGVSDVAAGTVARTGIGFVPFMDKRWWASDRELEGTLGLDFFRPYVVAADWQDERFYLSPRAETSASKHERLARWGAELWCPDAGCIQFDLGSAGDGTPLVVTAEKDPQARGKPLEVVLSATSPTGRRLPDVYLNLPASIDAMQEPIDAPYDGAHLEVIDMSPFPRTCRERSPCLELGADPPR